MAINPGYVQTNIESPRVGNPERDALLKALLTGTQQGATAANEAMSQQGAMDREKLRVQQMQALFGDKLEKQRGLEMGNMRKDAEKSLGALRDQAENLENLNGMLDDNTTYSAKAMGIGLARALEGKSARIQQQIAQQLGVQPSVVGDATKFGNWFDGNAKSGLQPNQAAAVRQLLNRLGTSATSQYQDALDSFKATAPMQYRHLASAGQLPESMDAVLGGYSRPFDRLTARAQTFAKTGGMPQNPEPGSNLDPNTSPMKKFVSGITSSLGDFFGGRSTPPAAPQQPNITLGAVKAAKAKQAQSQSEE